MPELIENFNKLPNTESVIYDIATLADEGVDIEAMFKASMVDAVERKGAVDDQGGDRKSDEYQGDNITLKDRGTSSEYTIRRLLKEDRQE